MKNEHIRKDEKQTDIDAIRELYEVIEESKKERQATEKSEQEKQSMEEKEAERARRKLYEAIEKSEQERQSIEEKEAERARRELYESIKMSEQERETIEKEKIEKERAIQELRETREKIENEMQAREKAEKERKIKEKNEQERLAREKNEEEIARRKIEDIMEKSRKKEAEQEKQVREKDNQEMLAKEKAKQKRNNIVKRIGAGLVAGLTAITVGIGTWWNRMFKDKNTKLLPESKKVYDINEQNSKANENQKNNENKKDNIMNYYIVEDKQNESTDEKKENPMDKYKLSEEDLQKCMKQYEKELEAQALKQFELGQAIKLPQGLEFTEGISGGKKGTIGDMNSPKEGVYIINCAAEVGNNHIINQYGLEGKLEKNMKDSDIYVHIAYVPGAQKESDAKKIIETKGEKEHDRGWVKLSQLKKAYDQRQREENQKQVEK